MPLLLALGSAPGALAIGVPAPSDARSAPSADVAPGGELASAQAALERGDAQGAEAQLRLAARVPESRDLARRALANLLIGENRLSELSTLLEEIGAQGIAADPLLAQRRIEMLILRARLADARAAAEAALAATGSSGHLHRALALIAAEQGQWPAAIDQSERAIRLNPEDRDAVFLHVRALIENGEIPRARDFCRRALEGAVPAGAHAALCVALNPADFAQDDGQKGLALAAIEDPAFPTPVAYLQGLVQLYWQGEGEAIALLERGYGEDSESLLGRYLLILRLLQLDRAAEARALAQGIPGGYLAHDPFVRLTGIALVAAGDWSAGYRRLERWTRKHPQDEEALRSRLKAAVALGDRPRIKATDASLAHWHRQPRASGSAMDQVLRVPDGLAEPQLALLLSLDRERRQAAAILEDYPLPPEGAMTALRAAERLVRQDPGAPAAQIYLTLERLRRDPGDARAARDLAILADRLAGDAPVVWMTLARIAARAGQTAQSRRILRTLGVHRPDYRPAIMLLRHLEQAHPRAPGPGDPPAAPSQSPSG